MLKRKLLPATTLAFVFVLLLLSPLVLYQLGLSASDGPPPKPERVVSPELQLWVWAQARGKGPPRIEPMNPYSVIGKLLSKELRRSAPGETVIWWVASDYLLNHQHIRRGLWWHLAGLAYMIQISRNWSTEEILSAGVFSLQNRGLKPSYR